MLWFAGLGENWLEPQATLRRARVSLNLRATRHSVAGRWHRLAYCAKFSMTANRLDVSTPIFKRNSESRLRKIAPKSGATREAMHADRCLRYESESIRFA